MTIDLIKRIVIFAVLCVVQALVFNRIHLFDCAIPLFYVYFALKFPRNYPRWAVLLWCFLMGLAIDTFSNTPGVAAASLTFVGLVQPYFFELFVSRDAPDNFAPSMSSMGPFKFSFYAVTLTLVYCILFFTLETFSFFNWQQWLMCIGGSTALTFLLVITIESVSWHEELRT